MIHNIPTFNIRMPDFYKISLYIYFMISYYLIRLNPILYNFKIKIKQILLLKDFYKIINHIQFSANFTENLPKNVNFKLPIKEKTGELLWMLSSLFLVGDFTINLYDYYI